MEKQIKDLNTFEMEKITYYTQKNFKFLLENMDCGIIINNTKENFKVEYVNKIALEYVKFQKNDFPKYGKGIIDFIYEEDRENIREDFILATNNKEDFQFEARIVDKDSNILWVSGKTIFNVNDIAITIFKDITEEKKAHNDLKINEERFRVAFSQTRDLLFDYNNKDKSIHFLEEENKLGLGKVVYNVPQSILEADFIEPESIDEFIKFFQLVESGVESASCVLKAKLADGNIAWGKVSIRSVYDENNKYIKGVGVIEDITYQKEMEKKYYQEEIYRSAMLSEALIVYEANITKNLVTRGLEYGKDIIDVDNLERYEDIILIIADKIIHKDDRNMFIQHFLRSNILSNFNKGIDEINIEYRRLKSDNEYNWASCTTHILRDPITKDVVMFAYAKDIHERKMMEISLKYQAERDLLTDLYNKKTTQKLITEIIEKSDSTSKHAFLIVDLDNFKSINDKYGHIFGDAILSEIGHRLKEMFRHDDVVGRIGGDEFVIFLNNINSIEICRKKANMICNMFREVHQGVDSFSPSGTVGISLYPKDGGEFFELYEKADSALYYAKELGKDRYFFYDKYIVGEKKKKVVNAEEELNINKKNFKNNILEYIFKILYHSNDLIVAIESVLKLVTNHFKFDRGYIFEITKDNLYFNNTFEYCSKGIESEKEALQSIKYEDLKGYEKDFKDNNIYVNNKERLNHNKVKTRIQCAIRQNGHFMGFIGFDDCQSYRTTTNEEIATIQTVVEILSTFLKTKRNEQEAIGTVKCLQNILDNVNSLSYVVNPVNNEIVFANKKTRDMFDDLKYGDKCYIKIRGNDKPCENCPINTLVDGNSCKDIRLYNDKYNIWSDITISYINWVNNEQVCLISYKNILDSI